MCSIEQIRCCIFKSFQSVNTRQPQIMCCKRKWRWRELPFSSLYSRFFLASTSIIHARRTKISTRIATRIVLSATFLCIDAARTVWDSVWCCECICGRTTHAEAHTSPSQEACSEVEVATHSDPANTPLLIFQKYGGESTAMIVDECRYGNRAARKVMRDKLNPLSTEKVLPWTCV